MIKDENFILDNGVAIPKIGFGTWQSKDGEEAYQAVRWALEAGYRHIDTALVYGNEVSVGQAIIDSKIPREEIFVTTKLPASIKNRKEAFEAFNQSLKNLQLDYLDLYLIHAPWPWEHIGQDCTEGNIEVWKLMVELYEKKLIRSIGVSNFNKAEIESLISATNFKPQVNQIRFFIGNTQEPITKYCQENNILIEAYSPFATGKILENAQFVLMANKYQVSTNKLCLKYCLQRDTLPLPKSVHQNRIIDNLDVNFEISQEDMEILNNISLEEFKKPLRS